MLKIAIACALGAVLSFLGTLGFAEEAPPPHEGGGPIGNCRHHQPTQDHPRDVTPNRAQEVNRLCNQLQLSAAAHPQPTGNEVESDGQADQNRLARLIDEENRLLDRELQSICRGC
jgi:hypothetical protein